MHYIILIVALYTIPVFYSDPDINPSNVLPNGDWFTPTNKAQQEANKQYHCAVLFERTGLKCNE